eukprot:s24_g30.t1
MTPITTSSTIITSRLREPPFLADRWQQQSASLHMRRTDHLALARSDAITKSPVERGRRQVHHTEGKLQPRQLFGPQHRDPTCGLQIQSINLFKLLNLKSFHLATQAQCWKELYLGDGNMVVTAPTGAGKTVLFELAILGMQSPQGGQGDAWIPGDQLCDTHAPLFLCTLHDDKQGLEFVFGAEQNDALCVACRFSQAHCSW